MEFGHSVGHLGDHRDHSPACRPLFQAALHSHLILTSTPQGIPLFAHFMDGEIEEHRGRAACPRPHSQQEPEPGLEPGQSGCGPRVLSHHTNLPARGQRAPYSWSIFLEHSLEHTFQLPFMGASGCQVWTITLSTETQWRGTGGFCSLLQILTKVQCHCPD